MGRTKTLTLNLTLVTPNSVQGLKQAVVRLSKLYGILKIQQVFPEFQIPIFAAICIVKVSASKIAAVMAILSNDPDVKSVHIAPPRKAQKRKK